MSKNPSKEYRPLPKCLTIKNSKINGLGLFAVEDIKVKTELGISHYIMEDEIIRTPLGGFYNHSSSPNAKKFQEGNKMILVTIKPIKKGDEITVSYTLPEYENYLNNWI